MEKLTLPPSVPPASEKQLPRSVATAFGTQADTVPRLLTLMQPLLQGAFYASWKSLPPPRAQQLTVYALRVAAAPFGHNAPLRQTGFNTDEKRATFSEWAIDDPWNADSGGEITLTAGTGDRRGTGLSPAVCPVSRQ